MGVSGKSYGGYHHYRYQYAVYGWNQSSGTYPGTQLKKPGIVFDRL